LYLPPEKRDGGK